ncbi:LamG-like jellyroll fold domain-containing protein, partial [Thermoproteota archaeon]
SYYWGGGGGASGYSPCGGNGGIGGGGGGAVCTTTGGAGYNDGSPGGGGSQNSQTNKPGGNAGANTGGGGGGGSHYYATNQGGDGGSGIVVIRYLTADIIACATNASGHYSWDITSPSSHGDYNLSVNITVDTVSGSALEILRVRTVPFIESIALNASAEFNKTFHFILNITDENLIWVNFTVTDPFGTPVIDNENGTSSDNVIWNSSSFTLNKSGTYNYTIIIMDADDNEVIRTGIIDILNVSVDVDPNPIDLDSLITVSGSINWSNGTAAADAPFDIFIDLILKPVLLAYENLVMYLTLDESGPFNDWSANDNDGVCIDCPDAIAGKYANASSFNGIDDEIVVADDDSIDNFTDFTITAWVNFKGESSDKNGPTDNALIAHKDSYELGLDFEGKPYFNIQDDDLLGNLTKHPDNPLIDRGTGWDVTHSGHTPRVMKEGGVYKMWFTGYGGSPAKYRIGFANSTDGIEWTKYAGNPVIDVGADTTWDDYYVFPGNVVKEDGVYKMWYSGHDSSYYAIGFANSTDGINWNKYASNPVMSRTSSSWHSGGVVHPYVIKEGGVYKMWYAGSDGTNWIGIGFANSTDGLTWNEYAGNPVMRISDAGEWDDFHTYGPSVIKDGDVYRMWYAGNTGSNLRIGYAVSDDGLSWTKYEDNPVIDIGVEGTYDDTHAYMPGVFKDGNNMRVYYTMHDGSYLRVGLANTTIGIKSSTAVTADEWHLVTAVKSGSSTSIYIDDTLTASGTTTITDLSTDSDLIIGRFLNGSLDDVKIYNKALTDDEISTIMTARTDASGNYNYSVISPSTTGDHNVTVNI